MHIYMHFSYAYLYALLYTGLKKLKLKHAVKKNVIRIWSMEYETSCLLSTEISWGQIASDKYIDIGTNMFF